MVDPEAEHETEHVAVAILMSRICVLCSHKLTAPVLGQLMNQRRLLASTRILSVQTLLRHSTLLRSKWLAAIMPTGNAHHSAGEVEAVLHFLGYALVPLSPAHARALQQVLATVVGTPKVGNSSVCIRQQASSVRCSPFSVSKPYQTLPLECVLQKLAMLLTFFVVADVAIHTPIGACDTSFLWCIG